jgi:hypothetical protein
MIINWTVTKADLKSDMKCMIIPRFRCLDLHADRHLPPLPVPGRLRLDVHGGIPDLRPSSQGTLVAIG